MFFDCGFKILSTGKTCEQIKEAGIPVELIKKEYEGRPNVNDYITNGQVQLIINSPVGDDDIHDDSYLRKGAVKAKIPYITTVAAARAAAEGIQQMKKSGYGEIQSLQEWHEEIR